MKRECETCKEESKAERRFCPTCLHAYDVGWREAEDEYEEQLNSWKEEFVKHVVGFSKRIVRVRQNRSKVKK